MLSFLIRKYILASLIATKVDPALDSIIGPENVLFPFIQNMRYISWMFRFDGSETFKLVIMLT